MIKNLAVKRIAQEIKEDNTLVTLQETGELNIDYIDEDLDLFIYALEKVTGKEYTIKDFVGYKAIVEY